MKVEGAVAVVTGGASGIGETVAKTLAAGGARVVIGDVRDGALTRVVDDIRRAGGEAHGALTDVSSEGDVARLMETAVEQFGAINIVCANAGIIRDSTLLVTDRETGAVESVMSTEDFRAVIDVNLVGAFLTVREAASRMVDNGWSGVIILTSSINKVGQVGQLNYCSSKAAIALWPKILAGEFHMRRIRGIRVVGVAPGYTATPILRNMNAKALEGIVGDVHIGRLVEPDEIASTFRHIVENDALDATTIEVTGGVTYGKRQVAK